MSGIDEGAPLFGRRRGWSLARRVREPDSYGLLLILILATLLASAVAGRSVAGTTLALAFAAVTLLFALRTSLASAALQRVMVAVAPMLVLGALVSQAGSSKVAGVVASVASAILVLGALAAIGRRLVRHAEIGGTTILGAVCAYLLLGLLFASVYGVFGDLGPVFVQKPNATGADVIYFSFVTLTTVGFGDLTASGNLVRMIAILESLCGQLYLVTVIAILIANVGSTRRR